MTFADCQPIPLSQTKPGGPLAFPPITADAYLQQRLHEIKLL